MKKIVQRTRRFEKSFTKLSVKVQKKFITKLALFLDNEYSPSLKTHQLKGSRKNEYVFSVDYDIRAIYRKAVEKERMIITFTFN